MKAKALQHKLWLGAWLALAGCAALAQAGAPAAAEADAPPAAHAGHDADHAHWRERMAQRHAEHLAHLKERLQLRAEQEGAWDSYRAAMQPAEPQPGRDPRAELAQLSTPERVERMNDWLAQRQAQMRARGEATKAFYAVLDAQQKQAFDQASLPPSRHHGHPG